MAIKGKKRSKQRSAPRAPRREPVAPPTPFLRRRWVQLTAVFLLGILGMVVFVWVTNNLRATEAEERSAESVAALRTALARARGKIALAGHSLGGRIALEAVRLAPDRIERLALLDTGVGPVRPNEEASRLALVRKEHEEGMDAVEEDWMQPR